jgi:hypothetical protein
MDDSDPMFDTNSNISRADLKIRLSGDRLMRADVRRRMYSVDHAEEFTILPEDPERQHEYHWFIEFDGLSGALAPVRLDIAGDVVMGVWRGADISPDLDLGIYCSEEKGVSRQHAMLRPSKTRLYLIDLDSTNGTRVNQAPVSRTMVKELHDLDMVSLGILTFTLRIIAPPQA